MTPLSFLRSFNCIIYLYNYDLMIYLSRFGWMQFVPMEVDIQSHGFTCIQNLFRLIDVKDALFAEDIYVVQSQCVIPHETAKFWQLIIKNICRSFLGCFISAMYSQTFVPCVVPGEKILGYINFCFYVFYGFFFLSV